LRAGCGCGPRGSPCAFRNKARVPFVHSPNAGRAGLGIPNEAELIARLRARDLEALGEVYRELGGRMTTLARTMLRDADEAADVVEDTLLKVRDAAPGFRGERGLTTWVMRIVANRCRDLLRRRKFSAGPPEDIDPITESGLRSEPIEGWDSAIDQERMLAALERAIDALPAEQREAVVLRDRLGLSYEEVAETLGLKVAAVKSRLFRARTTLKAALRPLGGE
jgi:RNA polymerase sigma-70 factor, ECF subfamily